jgi:hypothetical protein
VTVVVLTGASRGIGRAAAIELARRGADVVLVGRDPDRVRSVVEEARLLGGGVRVDAPFFRSPERGARSLVWLALSDDAAELTGQYIEDEKPVAPSTQAQDNNLAQSRWEGAPSSSGCAPRGVPNATDSPGSGLAQRVGLLRRGLTFRAL